MVKDQFFDTNLILYHRKYCFPIKDSDSNPIRTNLIENGKRFGLVRTQICRICATPSTHMFLHGLGRLATLSISVSELLCNLH
jgi:hypothetical protein